MRHDRTDPDYRTWLDQLFEHSDDEPEWYFSDDFEFIEISPRTLTAHVLRRFQAPALLMTDYSDQQIASGLKYLIDNACGGDIRLVSHPAIPQSDRLELAARIDRVYAQIFAARCAPALGNLSEGAEHPLNMLCYMWWDAIVFDTTGDARLDREFFAALIEAMGRTLAIPHPACQEGALHGLGHWGEHAPDRAQELIDMFLSENRAARPELVTYARAARGGCIQ